MMQFVTLEDEFGLVEAVLFPHANDSLGDPVRNPGPFVVEGQVASGWSFRESRPSISAGGRTGETWRSLRPACSRVASWEPDEGESLLPFQPTAPVRELDGSGQAVARARVMFLAW
jgi:hypothetical protein